MPAIVTRTPAETIRKDTGSGGRPPVYHRPTGGWGGGDENWDHSSRHGPRELLSRYRMGLSFALAGDLIFYLVLAMALFAQEHAGSIGPDERYIVNWRPLALPPILWINTAVLLLSSCTAEMARRGLFREIAAVEEWLGLGRPISQRAIPWMFATIALGGLFLGGQWLAWKQITAAGTGNPDNALHYFGLMTGIQALHLALGIVGAFATLIILWRSSRRLEIRQIAVDVTAWYWHAMAAIWIGMFGLMLLSQ
jgi:cytochrome c oxidase subunit 3